MTSLSTSTPYTIVRDLRCLPEDDPIKVYIRAIVEGRSSDAPEITGYIRDISARVNKVENVTTSLITTAAQSALVDPGYGFESSERFIQTLAMVGLYYPYPNSVSDTTAMFFWDAARTAKGLKDIRCKLRVMTPDDFEDLQSISLIDSLSTIEPPRRLTSSPTGQHQGHSPEQSHLGRAASIIQELYYIYQKRCYPFLPSKIEEHDGILYLHTSSRHPLAVTHSFPVRRFPLELSSHFNDIKACLTSQDCFNACGHLFDLITLFTSGLNTKLQEYHIHIRNAVRPTVYVEPTSRTNNNMHCRHTVIRATTSSGESFCLDFTGAQYGWEDTISPWGAFTDTRLRSVHSFKPFGTENAECRAEAAASRVEQVSRQCFFELSDWMVHVVREWLWGEDLEVMDLLQLPEDEFKMAKKGLLDFVDDGFGKAIDDMEDRREYHFVMRDGAVHIQKRGAHLQEQIFSN
ncbi:MAG: hypothetical protein M1820_004998 [Bogoriella megaspora]|nr:MAG: hypothetical protein M1820_004998 [Bogoriella megaspora]